MRPLGTTEEQFNFVVQVGCKRKLSSYGQMSSLTLSCCHKIPTYSNWGGKALFYLSSYVLGNILTVSQSRNTSKNLEATTES